MNSLLDENQNSIGLIGHLANHRTQSYDLTVIVKKNSLVENISERETRAHCSRLKFRHWFFFLAHKRSGGAPRIFDRRELAMIK